MCQKKKQYCYGDSEFPYKKNQDKTTYQEKNGEKLYQRIKNPHRPCCLPGLLAPQDGVEQQRFFLAPPGYELVYTALRLWALPMLCMSPCASGLVACGVFPLYFSLVNRWYPPLKSSARFPQGGSCAINGQTTFFVQTKYFRQTCGCIRTIKLLLPAFRPRGLRCLPPFLLAYL
jgi:hypothetical protein